MIQFLGYLNLIQLALLLIAIIIIVILVNILKKRKQKIIEMSNKRIIDQKKFFKKLEVEKTKYEKQIKSANNINDFKRIYTELSDPFLSNNN